MHDFCYERSNSLTSHGNVICNTPRVFFLLAYSNRLCPEYFTNMNLAVMQFDSVFTGQQQISEKAMFSDWGEG